MKETFELTIINQKRLIVSFILFPILFFISMYIGIIFHFNFGIIIFILILFLLLIRYYVLGDLTITIENEIINFKWKKKLIFNFREIENINLSDIKAVIVDNELFLRKIITKNNVIDINTSTIKPKDASKLISYFNSTSKTEKNSIKNSWENISKKKLKIFYIINYCLIITSIIVLILVFIVKGFNSKMFFILGIIPTLHIYGIQIKKAIDREE